MVGSMIRVSEEELNSFIENSELVENKINSEKSFEQDWFFDLGKDWDGIQYLLTGKGVSELSEPTILARAFFSYQILDEDQDLGYGPAQYLTSAQVKETSDWTARAARTNRFNW